ncbi:hypothetical protein ACFQ4O_16280, partial [Methylopila musalis]
APSRPLTLAVVGVEPDQTALSREQAEEARLAVEARLQATGRVRLAAAADVVRVKALRESVAGLSAAEAEAQIKAAFSGDAAVFLATPSRSGTEAAFRLLAIGAAADCKATSEPVTAPIRSGPGLADIDAVFAGAVRALTSAAPDVAAVQVCPFRSSGGRSSCGAALAERLTIALDVEARSADRTLREAPLTVTRAPEGRCEAAGDGVTALGAFDHDREGRSWMSLEFRRAGAVLAPTGRTRISAEGLGCDPAIRPFLEHVAASAPVARDRLDVAALATPFAQGQRLEVRIASAAQQKLYCWILAPDETAYVTLPAAGAPLDEAPAERRYPRDFGLADIVLSGAFENLFGCFAVEGGLPKAIEARWLAAAPRADGDATLLGREDVLDLIEQIRATPGVVEATTRIVVR